jgi:hypothetical protein
MVMLSPPPPYLFSARAGTPGATTDPQRGAWRLLRLQP